MHFVRLMVAACAFAGFAMAAGISLEPFATAKFGDGSVRTIDLTTRAIPGSGGVFGFLGELALGDGSVRIEGTYKSDPFIDMTVVFVDSGLPSVLSVTFGSPVVGGPYGKLTTNFSGVGPQNRQISVDGATFDAGVGDTLPVTFDPALKLTIASCSAAACGPVGPASVSGTYNPAWMMGQMVIPGPGDGNQVSFTGRLDIEEAGAPVPEPRAMGLAALGLGSVVWLRRRQQAKPDLP